MIRRREWMKVVWVGMLVAGLVMAQAPLGMQAELLAAENAIREAEAAGAAVYASSLYEEARSRLVAARENADHRSRDVRSAASLDAIEAKLAAEAAEAKARWAIRGRESIDLRGDIVRFGGRVTAAEIVVEPPDIGLNRGGTTAERIAFAENVVAQAREAGADRQEIVRAEGFLESARGINRSHRKSDTAEYLAYAAEMNARRAMYDAELRLAEGVLPGLRLERTRLAEQAREREATAERQRREQVEREAARLRAQLGVERESRQTSQIELEQLRQRISESERRLEQQLETDRQARIAAEQRLIELGRQYESAVASRVDPVEVDRLRRQIADQQLALREFGERERLSEELMQNEINRLQAEVEAQRRQGMSSARELDQQEVELDGRIRELAQLRSERETAEQRRVQAEAAFQQRIAEMERSAAASAQERAALQQQIESERARAAEAEIELQRLRDQAAQREQEQIDRIRRMETTLTEIAQTRRDDRGFIVTLPGIYFATGQAQLQTGARSALARIAEELRANPNLSIVVEGHTDSTGGDAVNQRLSEARAASVRDFLVTQGFPPERISTVGRGEGAPIASNDAAAGRQQNRRVELVIRTR
ncbi:MAG TPA: OmpA family protein [Thermoanaerobaculia bacterium]|nr:OmpA family protein [Thermoanaerobaculia bacterium]